MTRRVPKVTVFVFALLSLALRPGSAHPHEASPSAETVAARVMDAMGGEEAWNNTRFIRFSFAGRRTHWWDKWTGRHRLEGQTQDGKPFVVLHNINTRQGDAWVGGQKAEGDAAKELLERAYAAWINDTYWLVMPYKLRDPGVQLSYVGEEKIDGVDYDKLLLRFEKVGLTPGDRYWAYINKDTHLMDRWAYVLESMEAGAAPTMWLWQGWQKFGNIMLAPTRSQVGGDRKLELGDIAVMEAMPDSVFTSPEPVAK
jgi:hypothetical protein